MVQRGQDGRLGLSIYSGEISTYENLEPMKAVLLKAFPRLEGSVIATIIDRAVENGIPLQRIKDAVNHTIDTCEYLNFVPAKVLSYDLKCKLYSYDEACEIFSKTQNMKALTAIVIRGKRFYVSPGDKARYNLPDEIK